jgi:recombination protein RecA
MRKTKEDKHEEINGSEKMDDRKRAIEAAMSQIEKQFGKGSIMRLGGQKDDQGMAVISTGSLDLDIALGIGGLPIGRVVEIFGPESSGKTTLMLSTIAQAQKKGGVAAFIDAEHALDPSYAKKLGVNIDELLVSQPDNGEEALEICESLVRSNAIDIIVIDSVAALVPKAEIEGDMGDSHMGLQARLMSQALRKLTGTISKSKTIVVFINQIRMKIGVMFGSPETTTGGNALKFYASIRLDIRKIETIKDKEEPVGNRVRVKVVKNKCAPPFRQAEFDVMFNSGINREGSILDLGVKHDLIVKSGAWYSYNGEKIGQGREQARTFLMENSEIAKKLESQIRDLNDLPGPKQPQEANLESNSETAKPVRGRKASPLEEELAEAESV